MQARMERMAAVSKKLLLVGGAIGGASVKAFMDYEKQMAMVSTMLTGKGMAWMTEYKKGISDLSLEFGEGTKTLAKGMYDLLSAGVAPAEAMGALRIATEAAKGGFTSTAVVVDGMTSLLNAYGLSAKYAGAVTDMMQKTVNKGKLNMEELAGSVGKVAPFAVAAGLSMRKLTATIATLTFKGVKADIAMTQIRSALAYAADQGLTFMQVVEKFRGKSLRDMLKAGVDRRSAAGIAALSSGYKTLAENIKVMADSGGARLEAFAKYQATMSYQWNRVKQGAVGVARTLGKVLIPAVAKAARWVNKILPRLIEWIKAHRELVLGFVKWAGALLVAAIILPKIIGLMAALGKTLIWVVTSPIGLVLAGLAALVVGLSHAAGEGNTFVERVADGFMKLVKIMDHVLGSWEGLRISLAMVASQVGWVIYKGFAWLENKFAALWDRIVMNFQVAWSVAGDLWMRAQNVLLDWFTRAWLRMKYDTFQITTRQYLDSLKFAKQNLKDETASMERAIIKREKTRLALEKASRAKQVTLATAHTKKMQGIDDARKASLEAYLAKLEKLPRLSDKFRKAVAGLLAKLKKGVADTGIFDDLKKGLEKEMDLPPGWDAPGGAGGAAAAGGKAAKGGYEALAETARRISTAATGGVTRELAAAEEAVEEAKRRRALLEVAKTQRDKQLKAAKDLQDVMRKVANTAVAGYSA